LASVYNNLGSVYLIKNDYNKALDFYLKSLDIELLNLGKDHYGMVDLYSNIALVHYYKGNFNSALDYSLKVLELQINSLVEDHDDIAKSHFNIGNYLEILGKYDDAISHYTSGLKIQQTISFPYKIGQCYEALNNMSEALHYFIQSAEIGKEDIGLENEATQEAIINALRLAKELGKHGELPEWMR
jgi:tetratricopeptide (TPR) repeat protein